MNPPAIIENSGEQAVAEWLGYRLRLAFARQDEPVVVTVPGGSTPFPVMARLLEQDLPFARLIVWPNDDRLVPEDHPASNTGKLRALFERRGAQVATLSAMERVPRFDLAWLGMGADGHIASLFPNTDPRADDPQRIRRITPDPLPPEAPFERITLTLPALLDSGEIVFTLGGAAKRRVFEEAVQGMSDLPIARLLAAAKQPVTCFI